MMRTLTDRERKRTRAGARYLPAAFMALGMILAHPAHAASRGIVSRAAPQYPEMAKRMKITGAVKLEVTVDASGKVTEVKTISGNRMLSPAAEEAVRKWKFESGDGAATQEVEINFSLGN